MTKSSQNHPHLTVIPQASSKVLTRCRPHQLTPEEFSSHSLLAQAMPADNFFSLPLKIRLRIYRYTFASVSQLPDRSCGKPTSAITVGTSSSLPTTPGLLRVSRRIYKEAVEVLYGSNTYHFMDPERPLGWLKSIGPINVGRLRELSLFVEAEVGQNAKQKWLLVLRKLYKELSSLEHLRVYFDAHDWIHTGLGKDTDVLLALGRLRSLETIELDGGYSPHLPEFLRRATGADVLDLGWK